VSEVHDLPPKEIVLTPSVQILIFAAGLLIGVQISQAWKRTFQALGVQNFLETIGRILSAFLARVAPTLSRKVVPQTACFQLPDSAPPPADLREQQIHDSAQAVRSILIILTSVIERTEQAASESSQALKKLRESFDRAGLPAEMAAATSRLTEQIDRMISNNASLKDKLASSQKILTSQQRQIETLRTAVLIDGMTQLANRSYFDDKLAEMIRLRQRYDEAFFLIILDVDKFKFINDTYGHPAGDLILKGVASKIKAALRDSDFLARFGGDEFALILIKSTPQSAELVARKLCGIIRDSRFQFEDTELKVTLSIGAAEATAFDTTESLLERADTALYRVKQSGRNDVYFAVNPVSEETA
jgi:diguanylate cyclase